MGKDNDRPVFDASAADRRRAFRFFIQWHNYKTVTYKDGTAQSRNGQISEPNKKIKKLKNYENQTEPILRLGWRLRLGTNQETLCAQYHEIPANF